MGFIGGFLFCTIAFVVMMWFLGGNTMPPPKQPPKPGAPKPWTDE